MIPKLANFEPGLLGVIWTCSWRPGFLRHSVYVPRQSCTAPVIMIRTRAASLAYVKTSWTRMDHFTSSAFTAVSITTCDIYKARHQTLVQFTSNTKNPLTRAFSYTFHHSVVCRLSVTSALDSCDLIKPHGRHFRKSVASQSISLSFPSVSYTHLTLPTILRV